MPETRTLGLSWAGPSLDGRKSKAERFHIEFKLGPFLLARAPVDVTILDLGDIAVLGGETDLTHLYGEQLHLRSVPDRLSLAPICREGGMFAYPFYSYDRCWVATEGDFETYLASFSKTSRKGLKRRVKQLASMSGGALDIRHFANADVMDGFHSDARTVSAKTFQEKLMNDGLPAADAFRRYLGEMAEIDECYGSILYLDGKPISYLYCERQGPGWLAVYGGFDPAFAKLSPGTVHLFSLLEQAFGDPDCELFDFGPGRSDYKRFFATDSAPSADVLILRNTLKNRLFVIAHRMLGKVAKCGVAIAEGLQLKTLLRQKIRGR
ncbi:MAG: GNAT family N-acetyltransferase [Geminicoccaceae bacterium]